VRKEHVVLEHDTDTTMFGRDKLPSLGIVEHPVIETDIPLIDGE
jgi:hypothetical protein